MHLNGTPQHNHGTLRLKGHAFTIVNHCFTPLVYLQCQVLRASLIRAFMTASGWDYLLISYFIFYSTPWVTFAGLWLFSTSFGGWERDCCCLLGLLRPFRAILLTARTPVPCIPRLPSTTQVSTGRPCPFAGCRLPDRSEAAGGSCGCIGRERCPATAAAVARAARFKASRSDGRKRRSSMAVADVGASTRLLRLRGQEGNIAILRSEEQWNSWQLPGSYRHHLVAEGKHLAINVFQP